METHQRHVETTVPTGGSPGDTPNAAALDTARQAAEAFYKAGKKAIHTSLSRDSTQFMDAVRQEQGE